MPRSPFRVAQSFTLSAAPTSVASGDLNGDGHPDLIVTRLGSGSISVLLGNGKGGFSAGVDYAAGTSVSNALVADFNGDGKLDVAVTDSTTGSIDVLFGNGDGTFGKPEVYPSLGNAVALAAGRFTTSGQIDLAVASATGVSVLLNDGTGHFSAAAPVAAGSQPRSLAAADLKATGHEDLIVANQDGTLTVLLSDGSGHFTAQPAISAARGPLSSVIAGDFNGDGKLDLALAQANSNAVTVLLGNGDGSFQPGVNYTVGNGPARLVLGDFNGDGAADLVSISQISNTFSVLLGNGDGTFRSSLDFVAGNTPLGLVAGDFNADGHTDLAIVNSQDQTLAVPLGRGDGTFIATPVYRADLLSKAIAAGDLNGDGRADLVVSNYCGTDSACTSNGTATIFLANADGTYRAASTIALGVGPVSVALADLNGDKKLDLIALNSSDKTLSILAGNGDGTFGKAQLYSLSASPRAILVGDFNGDGKPDLAIASDCGQSTCTQPGTLDIWLGRGDGSVTASASYTIGYSPVSIAAGDLRSTGHLDVVVANACGNDSTCKSTGTATLLSNDGTGHFTAGSEITLGSAPSSIAIGNLSGTGLDLAVAERGSNQVAILHADGKGGFGTPVTYSVGAAPSAIAIADVNGDGRPDVAVAGFQSSTVSVLYGSSSGKLESAVSFPVGAGPESLVAVSSAGASGSSLVTANGDSGAAPMGSGITALGGSDPGTGTTTVAFTSTANTANVDQQVTLSGTVTAVSPAGTPSGNLVFAIDTSAGGTGAGPFTYLSDCGGSAGVALTAGAATCTTQLLPAGNPVNIQLQYSGDTNYAANTSTDQAQTISPADTTVTVGPTTTGTVDQQVTLSATVAPSTTPTVPTNDAVSFSATGTIAFYSDGTLIAGCSAAPVTNDATDENATASCQTTALDAGGSPHAITAAYNTGDPNYNGSAQSASVNQTIQPATTVATVISVAPSAPTVDQSLTFTAKVAPSTGSVVVPFSNSGTMSFYLGGVAIGGCAAQPVNTTSGQATCAIAAGLSEGSQGITAAYNSGDPNYSASPQSANFPVSVGQAATTASTTASPTASNVDQSVTLTTTVTPNISSNEVSTANIVAITGNVAFDDNGTPIAGCSSQGVTFSAASGTATATCITSALSAGTHSNIIGTYLSDTNYKSSPANTPATVTVSKASSTVTVTANPSAPTPNNPVTYTATITFPSPLAITPQGTVSFSDNGSTISTCTAESITVSSPANVYQATCDVSSLTGGSHGIVATYSGDANYLSEIGTLSLSIGTASTTTTVVSSLNPSTVNSQVTFTVSVQGGTSVQVTGTATVTADTTNVLGQCTVGGWSSATGIATCTLSTSALALGNHTIAAAYSGNSTYSTSTGSLTASQVVKPAATSLALSSVPATTASINESVTFTAVITAPSGSTAPSGTVAFTDTPQGGTLTPISSCTAVHPALTGTSGSNSTYAATCSTSSLILGSHSVAATYANDNNFTTSSMTETFTVTAATSSITLSSSSAANTSTVNQTVTFTATIPIPSGSASLKGTVAFDDNGAAIANCGSVTPSSVGVATCSDSVLTAASHAITAAYSGDPNFSVSPGNLTQTVNKAGTSLALSSSPNPSVLNQTVVFTATLTAPAGSVPIVGTVAFTDTPQGGSAAAISGCAAAGLTLAQTSGQTSTYTTTCTTSSLAVLSHTITATFGPDSNFATSSGLLSQTVNAATSNITLSALPASDATVNQGVVFTATIPSQVFAPKGTVTFTDNGLANVIPGCSGVSPTTNWIATCSDPSLTAGAHTIVAQYANDPNINVGNGTLTLQVGQAASTTTVTATPNPAFPASSVTFTATISTPATAVIPLTSSASAGNVTFTVNGTVISNCANEVLTLAGTGMSGTASCTTTTGASGFVDGDNSIVAQYTGDPNYSPSNNCPTSTASTCVSEVVADYSIAVKSVLQGNVSIPVIVGYTTANDPFAALTLSASSFGSFSGSPSITCTSPSSGAPACNLAQSTLQVVSGGTGGGVGIVIDATGSTVTPGTYAYTVTATDAATSTRTTTFSVVVYPASSALTVVSGNPGTGNVTLPSGVTLSSLSCLSIAVAGTSTIESPASLGVSCTNFAQGTAAGQFTMTVNTNNTISTASLQEKGGEHSTLLVAGLLGIPLFGLFGLISGRKPLRSNFFRLLAIVAIGVAALQTLGCGGSFHPGSSTSTTATGTTPAGTYYLLVEGTANGNKYDAVIEVIVTVL